MSSVLAITPRLWLDTQDYNSPLYAAQCEGGCDCACPISTNTNDKWALAKAFSQKLTTGDIRSIHLKQNTYCDRIGEHTIALNAKSNGIVVLDAQASHLLSHLPNEQEDLRRQLDGWSTEVFEKTVALLLASDILSAPQVQRPNLIPDTSETLTAWLHLTDQCNLSCKYCYAVWGSRHMATATARRAVESVFRSALVHNYTRVKLKYAGGEPTLNFQALQAAQEQAENLSARTGIFLDSVLLTNGVHITDSQIDFLLTHDVRVAISLDGVGKYQDEQRPSINRGQSSFELVARTLKRLIAEGISPHISITITGQSLPGLPELVEYLLDRELCFSFNFYREPDQSFTQQALAFTTDEMIGGLKPAFEVIENCLPGYSILSNLADRADLRSPHLRTCSVGRDYVAIDSSGRISKCQMDMSHPITSIDSHDPLAHLRADTNRVRNLAVDQKDCRECIWRYRCTGGCPRLTFQRTGRYDAKSPLCEVYQAILPEIVRLEALRLIKYGEPWDFNLPPS